MASPIPSRIPQPSVRERVARAVCARHGEGKNAPVCELGQTATDAALAEVRLWLLELADRREHEYPVTDPLSLVAAGDAGTIRGLARVVGEGIPGLEDCDG